MGNRDVFIGIDIGTTSTKGIIANAAGRLLANVQIAYPIYQPEISYAEQDPDEIANAVWKVIKQLLSSPDAQDSKLVGIGFSSAMHSVILVDEAHQPLTRCMIWADNRSTAEAEEIRNNQGLDIYRRTGTPIHPMSPLTKLCWLSRHRPELLTQAKKILSIKEYILYQMCGLYVVDVSIASTTGLFNLFEMKWDAQALEVAGIRPDQLSEPVPTTQVLPLQNVRLTVELGIPLGTPVVIGASDGVLANLGAGAIEEDTAVITIGTSGAVRTMCRFPRTDPQMRSFCYALTDQHWVTGGPINNGGIALQWFRDKFLEGKTEGLGDGISYDEMTAAAARVKAGAEGLLFLPYLTGERAPYWNARARGLFFGAGLHHQREHFIRAVLEGVIFSAYSVFRSLSNDNSEIKKLYATGGFVQSPLWLQMTADIFGIPVHVPESPESACLGAVMLTMLATGAIDSLEDTSAMIRMTNVYHPDQENFGVYQKYQELFEQLYNSVENHYETLANIG